MKVGDLRVFEDHVFGYGRALFVVTHIDDTDCSVQIRIIKTGKTEWWDRIVLFHDSKKVSDKNVLDKTDTTVYIIKTNNIPSEETWTKKK